MKNISLKDFLKTYTAISNKFVDEYYFFYELCENNNHGINCDLVINYLEYKNTKKFYERLREKYVHNIDFIIKRKINPGSKTAKRVEYFISLDCFEKICMESRTSKGEAVRDYFIILRKFINYYKTHFANSINKLVNKKKYVYIILVDKNKNIQKFGRSIDIRKRLYTYATGKATHPDIKFIMIVDNPKNVENCVKIFIDKYKFKNKQELYKIDYDILKSVIFDCAEITKNINDKIKNKNDYDTYIVYDEYDENEFIDSNNNFIGYEKTYKKSSNKLSKKVSKKTSKKSSKKLSNKKKYNTIKS
jgi:phage anti-repressor protein